MSSGGRVDLRTKLQSANDSGPELWQAIRDIYRSVLRRLNARLEKEHITFPQYNVLLEISRNGPLPMSKLGNRMLVAPANVTGLIDRMEMKGFVKRRRDSEDRRLYVVEITPIGKRIFRGISSRFREYTRGLGSELAVDELASTLSALRRIRRGMDAAPDL